MPNEQDNNPATDTGTDISKAQAQQQPAKGEEAGQFEAGRQGSPNLSGDQSPAGQQPDSPLIGEQGETLTQQRTDVGDAALQPERGEAESGFVGAEGQQDTSSELIDEEDEDSERKSDGE